jgi:hypothetical protein
MGVQQSASRVWIDGIQGFGPGECASSIHGCQARILAALGEPLSYDDLVVYSGFAFRVGVHNQLCPSAGHPCCGFMCLANGVRALPWRTRMFERWPGTEPEGGAEAFEAAACAAVRASIDRGVPVEYGGEEAGLIIGYADEGRRWWCVHPYHKNGGEAFWHDEVKGFAGGAWPWGITVWTEPKPEDERVSAREVLVGALRQAVEMWRTERCGDYFVGDAAYGFWLDWLGDLEARSGGAPQPGVQGNGWCYDVLVHCRRIAARWLAAHAGDLGPAVQAHLLAAAEHYARLATEALAGFDCPWSLTIGAGNPDGWTSALRQTQLARLEVARAADAAAVAEIAAAVAQLSSVASHDAPET